MTIDEADAIAELTLQLANEYNITTSKKGFWCWISKTGGSRLDGIRYRGEHAAIEARDLDVRRRIKHLLQRGIRKTKNPETVSNCQ